MILDTNALSALVEKDKDLIEKIRVAPRLAITLISLGEFHYGISLSKNKAELRNWLDHLLQNVDILDPNMDTLFHYAAIRRGLRLAGTPIPANDCWIGAIAKQNKMPIVSRDRHFDHVKGLKRINW